eukprot:TRINITY_DN76643_c0_g1_i1.p1 TRINITY_DN76643_c0_g1~~TRINITY_DN76643_c0_g1_i1.p1  ORF type:complete len:194 (-),score=30.54 TRINITY_DN76643_c0_g1_i1:189-770(-)
MMFQSPVALPQAALGSGNPHTATEMPTGSPCRSSPGSAKNCQTPQALAKSPRKLYNARTAMLENSPSMKMVRSRTAMPAGPPQQPHRSRTAMLCTDSSNDSSVGGGDIATAPEKNQLDQGGVPHRHQHRRLRTAMLAATDGSPHAGCRFANSRTAMVLGDAGPDATSGNMMESSVSAILDMIQQSLKGLIRRH